MLQKSRSMGGFLEGLFDLINFPSSVTSYVSGTEEFCQRCREELPISSALKERAAERGCLHKF